MAYIGSVVLGIYWFCSFGHISVLQLAKDEPILSRRKIFVPRKKRRMRRKRKTNLWRMEKAYIGSAVGEG